jgi:prepilin-type N-terminal cleavage/methylation domain-containing protein
VARTPTKGAAFFLVTPEMPQPAARRLERTLTMTQTDLRKKRSGFTPGKCAAFTLIELLVVIAIIAILASILFPVFAQARAKARQAACLSNMKQIGTAVMMYIQDYDEVYPPSQLSQTATGTGNPVVS